MPDLKPEPHISRQLLREIAERIRLRCGQTPCVECRRDADDLEALAMREVQ
jgi:hypothetical protein